MTAAASTPSIFAGMPLRKRGSNVAGARAWMPLRISPAPPPKAASWAVLGAVVVGLVHFDLADADARVVESAAQLLGEEPGQLLGGGIALAFDEGIHLVDVPMIEPAGGLHRRRLERREVEHVAGRIEAARLGVDDHAVVVAVQRLAARLAETHLVRGAEPELFADAVHRHRGL